MINATHNIINQCADIDDHLLFFIPCSYGEDEIEALTWYDDDIVLIAQPRCGEYDKNNVYRAYCNLKEIDGVICPLGEAIKIGRRKYYVYSAPAAAFKHPNYTRAAAEWGMADYSKRIEWCKQANISIFAARRDEVPVEIITII